MENKTKIFSILAMILTLGALIMGRVSVLALRAQASPLLPPGQETPPVYLYQQRNTVSVTGYSEMEVDPDQATIHLSIISEARTAKEAQKMNNEVTEKVKKALTSEGIAKDDIETESYYLHKKERWDPISQRPVHEGYTQTHSMKVTVKNLEKLGEIIDSTVNAGVNNINNVVFDLSKKKRADINAQALTIAALEAKGKAESLATALSVSLGQLISVSENNYAITPYYADYRMDTTVMAAEATPTPDLSSKKINVNLNVNVVYEIQ